MTTITINGHTVSAASQQEGGTQFAPDASQSNFILIQCHEFLKTDQIDALRNMGVLFLAYFAPSTYLCRYEPADLDIIRALPFVVYANVYHQDLVVNVHLRDAVSRLAEADLGGSETSFTVYVNFHHKTGQRGTAEMIELLTEMVDNPGSLSFVSQIESKYILSSEAVNPTLKTSCTWTPVLSWRTDIGFASLIDKVESIEQFGVPVLANYAARPDLRIADQVPIHTAANFRLTQEMYDGQGEVVVVTDDGFDQGITKSTPSRKVHPAFQDRVKELYNIVDEPNAIMDRSSHGTAVCGSIAANGESNIFGPIKGTAPKASLIVQSFAGSDGYLKAQKSLTSVFVVPYNRDRGARVYSNSWNTRSTIPNLSLRLTYDTNSRIIDEVMYNHKDLLVLFSAGNNGIMRTEADPLQIGEEAAAKNCVTVGACESSKPLEAERVEATAKMAKHWSYRYLSDSLVYGDINNVADFSSQGPRFNGSRIKPDVMAPGVDIYSARSQFAPLSAWPSPEETDQPRDFDASGKSPDDHWIFQSGTSLATPLVAGCCAVIRQCLLGSGRFPANSPIPSALVKALLINGTDDMQGPPGYVHARGPVSIFPPPNSVQGFGRVNQAASLRNITDAENGGFEPSPMTLTQAPKDKPLNSYKKPILVRRLPDPSSLPPLPPPDLPATLRATLVYTDTPGAIEAEGLNNALCLKVIAGNSYIYANTGTTNPDKVNNVQKVVWKDIPPGEVTLVVEVHKITPVLVEELEKVVDDQDFSLVWYVEYGELGSWDPEYRRLVNFWKQYRPIKEAAKLALTYGQI